MVKVAILGYGTVGGGVAEILHKNGAHISQRVDNPVEGKYILSYKPKNKLPVEEYLKMQGRFAHMFKPGNEWMIEEVQKEVDKNWEELLKLCEL